MAALFFRRTGSFSSRRARSFLPAALAGDSGFDVKVGPGLPGTLWLQTLAAGIARRAGAELFLGSLSIVPTLSTLPSVALIHDLTPLLFPEWHSRKNRLGFVPFIAGTVRRARRIAAVSDATRDDLVRAFPEAAGKTAVVPNGLLPPPAGPRRAAAERRPPVRPFPRHARAAEERPSSRGGARIDLGPPSRIPGPRPRRRGGVGAPGTPGPPRGLAARGADPADRLGGRRPRGAAPPPRTPSRLSEPLRGLRPSAPRGDGSRHPRRRFLRIVAPGGDRRRRPPPRSGKRPGDRGGRRADERRRSVAGRGARARGSTGPASTGGKPPPPRCVPSARRRSRDARPSRREKGPGLRDRAVRSRTSPRPREARRVRAFGRRLSGGRPAPPSRRHPGPLHGRPLHGRGAPRSPGRHLAPRARPLSRAALRRAARSPVAGGRHDPRPDAPPRPEHAAIPRRAYARG